MKYKDIIYKQSYDFRSIILDKVEEKVLFPIRREHIWQREFWLTEHVEGVIRDRVNKHHNLIGSGVMLEVNKAYTE